MSLIEPTPLIATPGAFSLRSQRESGRMSRLIEDLLSLSSIELDEHVRPTQSVRIDQVVTSVAELLEKGTTEKRMTIEIDIAPSLPSVRR